MQALTGITVIESGSYITGPYSSMLLADLGANVIKVERPKGGDPYRAFKGGNYSAHFRAINRNKKSITLDINKPEGQKVMRELIAKADIFIENTRAGYMDGLGLSFEELKKVNPRLVYVSITGFGNTGPYRDRPSYDTIGLALSGTLAMYVDPKDPRLTGIALSDGVTGMYSCYAALAGLAMRERTGEAVRVENSMLAATMAFNEFFLMDYRLTGTVPHIERKSQVNLSWALPCSDGKLVAVHLSSPEKFWEGLVKAVDMPGLATDPRFSTRAARIENYGALRDELSARFRTQPRTYWLKRLAEVDLPFAPIYDSSEIGDDPQVQAMGLWHDLKHPKAEATPALKRPVMINGTRDEAHATPPPLLGEHTEEILGSLGYTGEQIAALKTAQII